MSNDSTKGVDHEEDVLKNVKVSKKDGEYFS